MRASFLAGVQWAVDQTSPRWWTIAAFICAPITLLGLLVEHRAEPSMSADNALVAITFGLVIPALAFGTVSRVFPNRLDLALATVARHGADRRWSLLGAGGAIALTLAIASAVLAASTRLLGGSVTEHLLRDTITCAWIGALAGVAYAAWFLLGSAFGRRAGGRWWAWGADWLLGIGTGTLAIPWPRGHLRNLLGGAPVAHLAQPVSSGLLVVLVLLYVLVALLRTPR